MCNTYYRPSVKNHSKIPNANASVMDAQQSIYLHEKGEAGGARELGSHKLVERETRLGKAVQLGQLRLKPKAANQQAATVLLHALMAREN